MELAAPGNGFTVTLKLADVVPEPHELVPVTVTLPEEADEEKSTVIELVLLPEVIEAPEGKGADVRDS